VPTHKLRVQHNGFVSGVYYLAVAPFEMKRRLGVAALAATIALPIFFKLYNCHHRPAGTRVALPGSMRTSYF